MSAEVSELQQIFPTIPSSLLDSVFKRNNNDLESAIEDLLTMDQTAEPAKKAKEDPIHQLIAMGFSAIQAKAAFNQAAGDMEDALGFLLNSDVDLEGVSESYPPPPPPPPKKTSPKGKYKKGKGAYDYQYKNNSMQGGKSYAKSHASNKPQRRYVPVHEPEPEPAPSLSFEELQAVVHKCEDAIKQIESQLAEQKEQPPTMSQEDQDALVALFDEMIDNFNIPYYHQKYGVQPYETEVFAIRAREPVPPYYANVQHNSIYYRKVLSMQGLRNLIIYGRQIFMELKDQLFASDPAKYHGDVGLNRMRLMTGNTVDLDTVILRLNDPATVKVINTLNQAAGEPIYSSPYEFSQSTQAITIAIETAKPLLEGFISEFKLSASQQKARRVHPNQINAKYVPVAYDNASRGKWPLWRYINTGVDTMHVNVPNMADVIGALLKAPVAAARAYLLCKGNCEKLAHFYEDGISDSCFNGKWKALEAFNRLLDKEGSIVSVLEGIQAANQHIFTPEFFSADEEGKAEVEEMIKLIADKTGRDKTGTVRPITAEDVEKWVKDPSADI